VDIYSGLQKTENLSGLGQGLTNLVTSLSNFYLMRPGANQNNNSLTTMITSSTTSQSAATSSIGDALDVWRHHVGRVDATDSRSAWIDAQNKDTNSTAGTKPTPTHLKIGGDFRLTDASITRGHIALVQIHTTNRSDAWIEYQAAMMDQIQFWGSIGDFVLVNPPVPPVLNPVACPTGVEPFSETGTWSGYAQALPTAPTTGSLPSVSLLVDLSQMPNDWWAAVSSTGIDIRATDTANDFLPFDLIEFDKTAETGLGVIQSRQRQDNPSAIRLWAGNGSALAVPPCSIYGQYFAYDQNFVGFWPSGSGNDRTNFLRHLTSTGSVVVQEGASPVGSSASLITNLADLDSYASISGLDPFSPPLTFMACAQLNSGDNFTSAVLMGFKSEGGSTVLMSTTESASPARLIARNAFGREATAGNSAIVNPANFWTQSGLLQGTNTRIVNVNGGGTSFSNQSAISVVNLDRIFVGADISGDVSKGFNGLISLVSLHSTSRPLVWRDYWHKMMDQSTFWGAGWAWTADSVALGQ
jgi:hypothetical protein